MSSKWFWLAIWVLVWTGLAACAQAAIQPGASPTAASPEPAQPAVILTSLPLQAPAATKLSPFDNRLIDLTPAPETAIPGLKEGLVQTQKETVQSAIKDLAQRLGLSVDDVIVLSVIGQEYSADAFYCRTAKGRIAKEEPPQLISGETIVLEARGNRYEYHASDPLVVFCRPLL
jgi:hypothetical protein